MKTTTPYEKGRFAALRPGEVNPFKKASAVSEWQRGYDEIVARRQQVLDMIGNELDDASQVKVHCHGDRDGDCFWEHCPQLADGESKKSGRHCPLDVHDADAEGYY